MPSIEHVRPGDLILSRLINEILDRLDALEARVQALEERDQDDALIDRLIPPGTESDPLRPGQEVTILGQNFGFSTGDHRVFFDGSRVDTFKLGSSDTALVVDVPEDLGLPQQGRPVTLTASNGVTFDTRTPFVRPVDVVLTGDVDVLWNDDVSPNPDPNPVPRPTAPEGVTATFAYQVRSRASARATFRLSPTISVADWQESLEVLDDAGAVMAEPTVELDPDETVDFSVRATLTPDGVDDFDLAVTATAGTVTGAASRNFEFGEPVEEQDPEIDLAVTDVEVFDTDTGSPDPDGGSHDPATGTLNVAPGRILFLTFDATLGVATLYDVSVESSTATEGWTVELLQPDPGADATTGTYDETDADVPSNETPRFSVSPGDEASPDGELTFRIARRGEDTSQTRVFQLNLSET